MSDTETTAAGAAHDATVVVVENDQAEQPEQEKETDDGVDE